MPELMRSMAARLRQLFTNRRYARRHSVRLAVTVWLHETRPHITASGRRGEPQLDGVTFDISATGLSFILPAVRIGERYLAGEGQTLRVRLEHPTGPLEFFAAATRYERLDADAQDTGYLIGARITEIADTDRERLITHLRQLEK